MTENAADRLGAWLEAVKAGDWQAVWQAHDPDSPFLLGRIVLPRRDVALATYLAHQANVVPVLGAAQTGFFTLHEAAPPVTAGDRTVVMSTLRTGREQMVPAGFAFNAAGQISDMVIDPPSAAAVAAESSGDLARIPD